LHFLLRRYICSKLDKNTRTLYQEITTGIVEEHLPDAQGNDETAVLDEEEVNKMEKLKESDRKDFIASVKNRKF